MKVQRGLPWVGELSELHMRSCTTCAYSVAMLVLLLSVFS